MMATEYEKAVAAAKKAEAERAEAAKSRIPTGGTEAEYNRLIEQARQLEEAKKGGFSPVVQPLVTSAPDLPPQDLAPGVVSDRPDIPTVQQQTPAPVPTPTTSVTAKPKIPTTPDQPGGQIATVNGIEYFIPGSTMREIYGFDTVEQWKTAQHSGGSIGTRQGSLAPVTFGPNVGGQEAVTAVSREHGISQTEAKRLIELTWKNPYAEEFRTLTDTQKQSLIAATGGYNPWTIAPESVASGDKLPGFSTLTMVFTSPEKYIWVRIPTGEIVYASTPELHEQVSRNQREAIDLLKKENILNNNGFLVPGAYSELNKNTRQALYELGFSYQALKDGLEFEKSLDNAPPELKQAYEKGGIEAYNLAADVYNAKVEAEIKAFVDSEIKTDDYLRGVLLSKGVDAAIAAYEKRHKDIAGIYERNYTQLPDGQYILNKELDKMKLETPKLYSEVMAKGYDATFGKLETLKESDPKGYFDQLKTYGMIPENTLYAGTLPDGNVQMIQYLPETPNKELRKAYAAAEKDLQDKAFEIYEANPNMTAEQRGALIEASPEYKRFQDIEPIVSKLPSEASEVITGIKDFGVSLVPFSWIKDVPSMPAWQIAVNAGLDVITLIPIAGWGSRLVGKAILKAGTQTLTKTLTKTLPQVLIKAGEKQLATQCVIIAANAAKIDKLADAVTKAAKVVVKAEKAGNVDNFALAVAKEAKAKNALAGAIRKVGTDIAVLNANMDAAGIKATGKATLAKAVGMANKADDFATYLAATEREIARQGLKPLPKKVAGKLLAEVKAYLEFPEMIGDVATSLVKAAKPTMSVQQISKMSFDDWLKWAQKTWEGADIPTKSVAQIKGGAVRGTYSPAYKAIEIAYDDPVKAVATFLHELGHARTLTPANLKRIRGFTEKLTLNKEAQKRVSTAIKEMAAEKAKIIQGISPGGESTKYIKAYADNIARITNSTTAKQAQKLANEIAKSSVKTGKPLELWVYGKQVLTSHPKVSVKVGGMEAGADYLRGGSALAKLPKGGKILTQSDLNKQISNIETALAKTNKAARKRLSRFKGKDNALDKWSDYIQESWSTGGATGRSPKLPPRSRPSQIRTADGKLIDGGGVGVATRGGVGVSSTARAGERVVQSYTFPIRTLAGIQIATIFVNPETGDYTITPVRQPVPAPSPRTGKTPSILPSPVTPPKPGQVTKTSPTVKQVPGVVPATVTIPGAATDPAAQPASKTAAETSVKPATETSTATDTKVAVTPATAPATQPAMKTTTKVAVKTLPNKVPKVIPLLPDGASDKEKRDLIKNSEGAVAWNMGKLSGRSPKGKDALQDVWHVRIPPYGDDDHIVVKGKAPDGATVADGPGSAYKTAQALGGKVSASFTQGHGAFKAKVTGGGKKGVDISFQRTSKGHEDVSITGDNPRGSISDKDSKGKKISDDTPAISPKGRGKISTSRGARITPPRRRIR